MAYAEKFSVDMDLKKPAIAAKEKEADEWLNKGNAAYQTRNYDEAIKCYKKATALDSTFASAFYNLGIIYGLQGLTDESIAAYKQVLTIDPTYHAARNNLASLYIKKGMIDEAISELNQAIAGSPDFPHAHFNLGECYFAKGNKVQAAEHYYKAGILFVARKDKVWAERSYASLKKTNDVKLEKGLLQKMNEEVK
jgi:superkiller protein 3